jgi:hypothetical protein
LCGSSRALAEALAAYALSAAQLRRFEDAEAALAEAQSIPAASAALRLRLFQTRAILSSFRGDLEAASHAFEQVRKENRALGNAPGDRRMALNLAEVEHMRGQTQRAVAVMREVLPEARAHRNRRLLGYMLVNLAGYLVAIDDLPEACVVARESLGEFAPLEPDGADVAVALEHLALAIALGGDLPRAAKLAGYADATLQKQCFEREFTETTSHDRLASLLREHLAPEQREQLLAEGAALAPETAMALAFEEPSSP